MSAATENRGLIPRAHRKEEMQSPAGSTRQCSHSTQMAVGKGSMASLSLTDLCDAAYPRESRPYPDSRAQDKLVATTCPSIARQKAS